MKQVQRILADYSADLFGTCSALYELGGMVVMDDASGCNSTYATHDEPRWFDIDSMIYITALSENDAVMGNDGKIIEDVCEAALARHPRFIALCGSPIAMMMGTDFKGLAHVIEKRTGIPSFGILSSGMKTYEWGAGQAFEEIVNRFCPGTAVKPEHDDVRVNLLGVTPLDFSINGNAETLESFFAKNGCTVVSSWAMNNQLDRLSGAGTADVNVVVSVTGLKAAEALRQKYGTPYVTGIPEGVKSSEKLIGKVYDAAGKKMTGAFTADVIQSPSPQYKAASHGISLLRQTSRTPGDDSVRQPVRADSKSSVLIIGEPVSASSLRSCLEDDFGFSDVHILCALEETGDMLRSSDYQTEEEDDISLLISRSDCVIADPIFRRVLDRDSHTMFADLPHEAYSGRLYRDRIPVFIGSNMTSWLRRNVIGSMK